MNEAITHQELASAQMTPAEQMKAQQEYFNAMGPIAAKLDKWVPLTQQEIIQVLQLAPEYQQFGQTTWLVEKAIKDRNVQAQLVNMYKDETLREEIKNFLEANILETREIVLELLGKENAGNRRSVADIIIAHRAEFADLLAQLKGPTEDVEIQNHAGSLHPLDPLKASRMAYWYREDQKIGMCLASVCGEDPAKYEDALDELARLSSEAVAAALAYGIDNPARAKDTLKKLLATESPTVLVSALFCADRNPKYFIDEVVKTLRNPDSKVIRKAIEVMMNHPELFDESLADPEAYRNMGNQDSMVKMDVIRSAAKNPQVHAQILRYFATQKSPIFQGMAAEAMAEDPEFFAEDLRKLAELDNVFVNKKLNAALGKKI